MSTTARGCTEEGWKALNERIFQGIFDIEAVEGGLMAVTMPSHYLYG